MQINNGKRKSIIMLQLISNAIVKIYIKIFCILLIG